MSNLLQLLFFTSLIFSSQLPLCTSSDTETEETEDEREFDYLQGSKKGPKYWGKINPHWEACERGDMQSPIDILNSDVHEMHALGKLRRDYKPAQASVKNRGHDIMVKWRGGAGNITINETEYILKQCHWHSPSEHTFNGSRHQLELHMVHESHLGRTAVVGITYKYGTPDPFLAKIIPSIGSVGEEEKDLGIINPGNVKFGSRKYYRYVGSLTVPPCTEGVIWTIIKKVRTASREQIRALREAVHDHCETNARPVQHEKGRTVWLYTPRS
ncbi:hypothetical protein Sjap_002269 [Stephania japonica]|uniref:carbonic anhydrase n=1 Tax=Stephania japonica TaxID=461633 RepID=A0AAP0KND0_9MAGN